MAFCFWRGKKKRMMEVWENGEMVKNGEKLRKRRAPGAPGPCEFFTVTVFVTYNLENFSLPLL